MSINEILEALETQKSSIERAISALQELSGAGLDSGTLPGSVMQADQEGSVERPLKQRPSAGKGAVGKRAGAKTKRPVYTDEFRRGVVAAVRTGMTFGEAAKKFRTSWFSVREWVNSGRFEPGAVAAVPAKAAGTKKGTREKVRKRQSA